MEAVYSIYGLEVQVMRILRDLVGALDIWRHKVKQGTKQRAEDYREIIISGHWIDSD